MADKIWSIIIPARNEEALIGRCLDSISALQFDANAFEVILADNGSTDRTIEVARSYSDRIHIRIISVPGVRVGAVRNVAAATACGRFLAFLDADCLVPEIWLDDATRVANEQFSKSVFGSYYALPADAGWPARLWRERFHDGRSGAVSYLPGGNMMMSRDVFNTIGGFDPDLTSNEDSELCSRARAAGFTIVAVPALATVHFGAEKNLGHFIRRQRWHGSNVVSRFGLRGNIRALALAGYTLVLGLLVLVCLMARWPMAAALCVCGVLLPPIAMTLKKLPPPSHVPGLVLLLLTYSIVRAFVLPIAIVRGIRRLSSRSTAGLTPQPE